MVKRLYETNILSRKELEKFMIITDEQVDIWCNRLGLSVPVRSSFTKNSKRTSTQIQIISENQKAEKLNAFLPFSSKPVPIQKFDLP